MIYKIEILKTNKTFNSSLVKKMDFQSYYLFLDEFWFKQCNNFIFLESVNQEYFIKMLPPGFDVVKNRS